MSAAELEFAETAGEPRDAKNFWSTPDDNVLYVATKLIWPWVKGTVVPNRMMVPSVFGERMLRLCKVKDPTALGGLKVMERCLGIDEFVRDALDELITQDIFVAQDDDGNDIVRVYDTEKELLEVADAIIEAMPDEENLKVDESGWDWLEGFANNPGADQDIAWLATGLNLTMLTQSRGDLYLYTEFKLMMGEHGTEASRIDTGGIFWTMVGAGASGGQLAEAIRKFYFPGSTTVMHPNFLLPKLPSLLEDTEWPREFNNPLPNWQDYSFDLMPRASYKTATHSQLAVILQPKLPTAIIENFPVLWNATEDYLTTPHVLVKVIETLGHAILPDKGAGRSSLLQLAEIEDNLNENWAETIQADYDAGLSTEDAMRRLLEKVRGTAGRDADKGSSSKNLDDDYRAPKAGQVARALAEKCYVKIEAAFLDGLRDNKMSVDKKLDMLTACFLSESVMTTAVLFDTKSMRISVYINSTGADFLALLHGERHLLPHYFMQTFAYDDDSGEVPVDLRHVSLSQVETDKITNLEWPKRDKLNAIILVLKAAEAGTTFDKHDQTKLYHSLEMFNLVLDIDAKLYLGIGYPASVEENEGVTFRKFMSMVKKILTCAVGMPTGEQANAYAIIDQIMHDGEEEAAQHLRRLIYGPTPADRKLGAWLPADSKVLIQLTELVEGISDVTAFRRKTGNIFGTKPKAAPLAGFSLVKGGGGAGPAGIAGGGAGAPAKPPKKKRDRKKKAATPGAAASGKAPAGAPPGGPIKIGAAVVTKRIFVYENKDFSINTVYCRWPQVAAHLGIDPNLCGPCTMAFNEKRREEPCPWGHAPGCAAHKIPMVKGKPFSMPEYQPELDRLKLTEVRDELKAEKAANKKPPGPPRKVNGTDVYPTRPFA